MNLQSLIIQNSSGEISDITWQSFIHEQEILDLLATDHPDKLLLQPQENKYSVSDIQKLVNWNQLKPYSSKYKVGIITHAQLLSPESQNKLLKTLEEPTPHTLIILITKTHNSLLDTVISRCVVYNIAGEFNNKVEAGETAKQFITVKNLNDRLSLIEEIVQSDSPELFADQILTAVSYLVMQRELPITFAQLLELHKLHRKNKYNIKLTLETLAIMLVE